MKKVLGSLLALVVLAAMALPVLAAGDDGSTVRASIFS